MLKIKQDLLRLRKSVEPSTVLEDIIKLHEVCKKHGVQTLEVHKWSIARSKTIS